MATLYLNTKASNLLRETLARVFPLKRKTSYLCVCVCVCSVCTDKNTGNNTAAHGLK